MCLTTTEPAKIAEKPIIVYKILLILPLGDEIYRTPCMGNSVTINDTLKASVVTEPSYDVGIYGALVYTIEGEGVHAYTSIEKAKIERQAFCLVAMRYNYIVTEWEIPAGAKFWEGTDRCEGEIAATEMKFIKVCENYKYSLAPTILHG